MSDVSRPVHGSIPEYFGCFFLFFWFVLCQLSWVKQTRAGRSDERRSNTNSSPAAPTFMSRSNWEDNDDRNMTRSLISGPPCPLYPDKSEEPRLGSSVIRPVRITCPRSFRYSSRADATSLTEGGEERLL